MDNSYNTIQKIVLSETQNDSWLPQDEITLNIDGKMIPMINGRNSYLRFNVTLSGTVKANLDRNGGGGYAVLDNITIYTGDGATQLELLENVGCYMGVRNYFDKTSGKTNMRNLLEGLSPDTGYKSQYFTTPAGAPQTEPVWETVECCLPLYQSGIFFGDKVFPSIGTGGLMIKIRLANAIQAIETIGNDGDNVNGFVNNRLGQGIIPTINDLPWQEGTGAVGAGVPPAGEPSVPLTVPQMFQIGGDIAVGDTTLTVVTVGAGIPTAPAPLVNLRSNANAPTIQGEFPWTVGETLFYVDDAPAIQNCGAIINITEAAGTYTITFTNAAAVAATAANNMPCFVSILNNGNPAALQLPTYTLTNLELVLSCMQPSQQDISNLLANMNQAGGYSFDIKTFNLYRNNQYRGEVKTQQLLPTTEFRAKSLLQLQINPFTAWATSFYRPIHDFLHDYQYIIANKNIPSREVRTNREAPIGAENSWNAVCDSERVKALEQGKVEVQSELHPGGHFCFGRAVAMTGYSANLNKNEVRLNQAWGVNQIQGGNVVRIPPQVDKLLYTFVYYFKKINMTPGNVVVEF
mgnify:CR=1 FL=1